MTDINTIQATVDGNIGHVRVECNDCAMTKTFAGDNAVSETKSFIEEHNYKLDHDEFDVSVGVVTMVEELSTDVLIDTTE